MKNNPFTLTQRVMDKIVTKIEEMYEAMISHKNKLEELEERIKKLEERRA